MRQRDADPGDSGAREAVVTPDDATGLGRRPESAMAGEGAESAAGSQRVAEDALSCGVALRPPRMRTYPRGWSLCPATTRPAAARSRDDQEQTRGC